MRGGGCVGEAFSFFSRCTWSAHLHSLYIYTSYPVCHLVPPCVRRVKCHIHIYNPVYCVGSGYSALQRWCANGSG